MRRLRLKAATILPTIVAKRPVLAHAAPALPFLGARAEKKKNAADATENKNEKQLSAKPTDDSDGGGLLINEDIGYDG